MIIIDLLINRMIKKTNKKYNNFEIENIHYGFNIIWLTITKLIPLTLIAIKFKFFTQFSLMLLIYGTIKLFSFGAHAKNSLQCFILSTLFLLLPSLILKYFVFSYEVAIIINLLCIPSFWLWAPRGTNKRPIINKFYFFKIMSVLIAFLFLILTVIKVNYYSFLTYACILQSIIISPILNKNNH